MNLDAGYQASRTSSARRPGWHRCALLALAVAAAGVGCGNKANDKPMPAPNDNKPDPDTTDTTAGGDRPDTTQGKPPMSDKQKLIDVIQAKYAAEFKVSKGDIKVNIESDVAVPGITVFSALANPSKVGRHVERKGIVEGDAIYTETDAMSRVVRAWGYGEKRSVSAADFARVMGFLQSATHGTSAIVDADTLDVFQATAYPKQAAAAALPKESTVDGLPAVVYSVTSGARTIPFTVVTAIVKPDFTVELRRQEIPNE